MHQYPSDYNGGFALYLPVATEQRVLLELNSRWLPFSTHVRAELFEYTQSWLK